MLPAAGYLVIAWQADNPGVWLAHCQYVVSFRTPIPFLSIDTFDFFFPLQIFFCARWKRLTDCMDFFFYSIGWHTAEGFALQFVERYDEIAGLYNSTELEDSCEAWSTFQTSAGILQDDDGI